MRLTDKPVPRPQEWMRADPDYDDHLPDELPPLLVIVPLALACFLGLVVFIGLCIVVLG